MAKQSADQVSDWNGQSGERWLANQARLDALVSVFGLATIEAAAPATGGRVLDIGCGARLRDRSALSRPDEEHAAIAYAAPLSNLWMMRRAAFEPDAAPLAPHRLYVDGSVRQIEF